MESSLAWSVARVFLGLVEARDDLLKSVATLVVRAVAGHAHLRDVAALVADFGGLNGLEHHQLGVHLLLDQLDLQLLTLVVSLLGDVRLLHLPLDTELLVLTNDGIAFLIDVLLVDVGLGSGSRHLVLDRLQCLFVFMASLINPVLILIKYLLLGLVNDRELSLMLVNLLSDFLVDLVFVKSAFQVGVFALLLHDQVRLAADFVDLALDLESVELGLLLHLLAILSLHVLEELA